MSSVNEPQQAGNNRLTDDEDRQLAELERELNEMVGRIEALKANIARRRVAS